MLKYCPYCGSEIACAGKFCISCGAGIPEELLKTGGEGKADFQNAGKEFYGSSGPGGTGSQHVNTQSAGRGGAYNKPFIFKPYTEQNEQAFTILIPHDWHVEGGIFRPNPLAPGAGLAQGVQEPFVNMAIMKDPSRKVMLHYLPSTRYYNLMDPFFPPGSTCNGMIVLPFMSAEEFLMRVIIPQIHPGAYNITITDKRTSPSLIKKCQEQTGDAARYMQYNYDSIILDLTYEDNGIKYREKIITATVYYSLYNTSMWENKDTKLLRAPVEEFDTWEPIFNMIESSVKVNVQWAVASSQGVRERAMRARETQNYIQDTYRQIAENKQKVQAEINKEYYLFFTQRDEYVNPYTGTVETDTSKWSNRWVSDRGYILYTDENSYDPNNDQALDLGYFKTSRPRPR